MLTALLPAWSQANWEGSAVVGRYGEFPPGGLYAASNTFPLNSMIDVTNVSTGETARLIVARELDDSGVFLLLSEAAASALGVATNASATVRATPVQLPGLTSVDPNQDLPFHPDPDVNPAASLGDPNRAIVMPRSLKGESAPAANAATAAAAVTAPAEPAAPPAEEAPAAISRAPVSTQPSATSQPAEESPTDEPTPTPTAAPDGADASPAVSPSVTVAPIIAAPDTGGEESEPAEDVVGVAPSIAESIVGETRAAATEPEPVAEPSMPVIAPAAQAPLIVELDVPPEPGSADERPQPEPTTEPEPVASGAEDPLAQRLDDIAADLDSRRVSQAPLELSPPEGFLAATPDTDAGTFGTLPEVDLSAAITADVTDAIPSAPNPVRVVAELPPAVDRTAPQVSEPMPASPELAEDEIALPIVPLDELEGEEGLRMAEADAEAAVEADLPRPDLPSEGEADVAAAGEEPPAEEAATAEEAPPAEPEPALRPTLIPEDAVVSLEPADYRSPEAPEPRAEDLEAAEAPPVETGTEVVVAEPEVPERERTPAEPETPAEPAAPAEPDRPAEPGARTGAVAAVESAPAETRPQAEEPAVDLPLVAGLDENASYVQVAALSSPQSVRRAIDTLGASLPVAVLSQEANGRSLYRVYVGPLSDDEKGSALYRVRSRGFRDAFVR